MDENATAAMRHKGQPCLNLKCNPVEADFLHRPYKGAIAGCHVNKAHGNAVIIGADVPEDAMMWLTQGAAIS